MSTIDLDAVILGRAKPGCVARYQTASGDVVYAGSSDVSRVSNGLARGKGSGTS